ncbi:MAG: RagB/SusD family nutrient uptake outer membrane protein [Prevotella sp.]|nr:RagB/SusD family nutrient uptake outer membrane protein [Prevotella sp.]MBR1462963.1 RagB/SusD family nutrient uptake outer membrane protein [Prevotella sp.]
MKYLTKSIAVLGLFSMALASCSDSFLDTSSKTESNTESFYKTQNDANRALIGCYDGWRQTSSNPGYGFFVASEVMGAECFGATGNTDGRGYQVTDRFDISQSSSDLNLYEADWARYYEGIYRCNELIKYEDQIEWTDETIHSTYMGECHALRAILYFDLVRWFGNIPLLTVATQDNVPQADPAEVYQVIFDDLQYAIDNIPANAYPKADAENNDGRITKYAAEALYARAYLYYNGYYGKNIEGVTKEKALACCEDVINSGEYSLVPEYKNLWPAASAGIAEKGDAATLLGTYAGDGNSETVLSLKFTNTQDYNGNADSNRWQVMVGMRSLNAAPYGKGWGAMTVNPQFVNSYEAGDLRKEASIIDIVNEGVASVDGFDASYSDWREYTGYCVKKYSPICFADGTSASKIDGSGDFQTQNHQDWVIVRYADVLLMAAELGSGNAQKYLDQVRNRAGLQSVAVTQANIMKERKYEFAFEAINYWDLLRQGVDYAASQIATNGIHVMSGGIDDIVVISAQNIINKQGLSQIPQNQITLSNGVLKQNAGW